MIRFAVTVRTEDQQFHYTAIAACSVDVVTAAASMFGVCSVSVKVKP